jgi:glutathione-regulated potassium-efflux system ancillary protein KefC
VTGFERETFDGAVSAGKQVLRSLGFGAFQVEQAAVRFKEHDLETMHRLHAMRRNETEYLTRAIEAREEIERMLATDSEDQTGRQAEGWHRPESPGTKSP